MTQSSEIICWPWLGWALERKCRYIDEIFCHRLSWTFFENDEFWWSCWRILSKLQHSCFSECEWRGDVKIANNFFSVSPSCIIFSIFQFCTHKSTIVYHLSDVVSISSHIWGSRSVIVRSRSPIMIWRSCMDGLRSSIFVWRSYLLHNTVHCDWPSMSGGWQDRGNIMVEVAVITSFI